MSTSLPGERGHGNSSRKGNKAPLLAYYQNDPIYDLATIVQLVGVRPMILWGWEQQLGVPTPARLYDEAGNVIRRYSERDIVAATWLREQILNGVTPSEASLRLRAAQDASIDTGGWDGNAGASGAGSERPRIHTGPLGDADFILRQREPKLTRPLSESDQRGWPADMSSMPGASLPGRSQISGSLGSGSLGSANAGTGYVPYPSSSQPQAVASLPPQRAALSGPMNTEAGRSNTSSALPPLTPPPTTANSDGLESKSALSGMMPSIGNTRGRELRVLQPQLIQAFAHLDTLMVDQIVREALIGRNIETLYISLLQPALVRISDQWSRSGSELTIPEERFAVNYVRALLFSFFHNAREHADAPFVIVACGPRELDDIGALVLAVFWRRAGMRVVFLGQDIEAESLVDEVRQQRPALVAIAVSATQRIRSLARLAKQINQLDSPRPVFTFYGGIFARNPELQRKIGGIYLGDDAATATWHVTRLLGIERTSFAPFP